MQIKIKYADGMEEIKRFRENEWYDLRAAEDVTMWAGDFANINLGVAIELPEGFEAIVAPRSSTFERLLSGKLDDAPFVSLFGDEPHWKGGPSAHCLI